MPVVAVPGYTLAPGRINGWTDGGAAVPDRYVAAFRRAGLQPAILPPATLPPATLPRATLPPATLPPDRDDGSILAPFAGLALIGGGDLDPARYRQAQEAQVYGLDPGRDELELALARWAVEHQVPLLAICRGMQVLNVALGGTLHQHIPNLGYIGHGAPEKGADPDLHDVIVEPGSRLAAAVGMSGRLSGCSCSHHQAVDAVGAGLVVTARSPDGVIEALEGEGRGWLLAVQWHPERTAADDPTQQAIFDAFAQVVGAGEAVAGRSNAALGTDVR